jgi:FlaA1/EpsC-like NDP-sugar epimerase
MLRLAMASITIVLLALVLTPFGGFRTVAPRSGIILLAGLLTGMLWTGFRLAFAEAWERRDSLQRLLRERTAKTDRVLIVGAGRAGLLVLQEISHFPELGHKVIGFIDDAPGKKTIRVAGIPVLGGTADLPALLKKQAVSMLILAIPSAPGAVIRRFTRIAGEAGVRVKTVPGLFNFLGSQTWTPEIKDVAIEDLLRRAPVHLDQTALSQAIEDSVVLITGGGGSIGSELARQVAAFRPARIVLLGRGENILWEAERSMRGLFPNQSLGIELCDIRDPVRLHQAFARWKPEILLHAAAHKHVPYLERQCAEGIKNNVIGTLNVVREAEAVGAHTLVNISTDKAVNPASVLGATKFLAECIVLDAAASALPHQRFVSVRFGNVLGSRGSVIPLFREQIRRGGPLTVTHPDMTRYFMTIPEASQLVLQAGILGGNGKIFVLDMGEPVRIMDLAEDMARLSGLVVGQDILIQYSGIRPGEKLFEETFLDGEERRSGVHPKIFEGVRRPLEPGVLQEGIAALTRAVALPEGDLQREILRLFKLLVPQYRPSPTGLGRFERGVPEAPRSASGQPGIQ